MMKQDIKGETTLTCRKAGSGLENQRMVRVQEVTVDIALPRPGVRDRLTQKRCPQGDFVQPLMGEERDDLGAHSAKVIRQPFRGDCLMTADSAPQASPPEHHQKV